jgi:magnesium-transporting ATPase (P-type)
VFLGLGISFSTLQDTTKVQNNFSKRIYQNARSTKIFILILSGMVLFFCLTGLSAFFMSEKNAFSELAFGLISVGIGMIGMLKAAVEMAEYQQNLNKI